ncbi:hypothetical protein WBP_0323 [Wolbachia endosymbiont of Brugia pahangi]|nr:hypothetical protein WBP_0323 [Wolbachia endosymbiont of Brugia pahangi]
MIDISQIQFPSRELSKLKSVNCFAIFISLSILVNPATLYFHLATIFFRSEIKTFYTYKEIRTAKQHKISKKRVLENVF